MGSRGPVRDLEIGEVLTQSEVQEVFETDFGFQFKGITYRNPPEGRYIIINSNEGAVYDDQYTSEGVLRYDGEGEPDKGDQKLTTSNRALIDAVTDEIPVYLFTSQDGIDEYQYEGLVEPVESRYVYDEKEDRMKYQFDLRELGIATWDQYESLSEPVKSGEQPEPELEVEEPEWEDTPRRVREAAFSREIKNAYDGRCAICGSNRVSPTGNPEVESAHLYPKGEGGRDIVQNGISLCRLHHWALDVGWLAISDDYEVLVREVENVDMPIEIEKFEGEKIGLPADENLRPGMQFLEAHRRLHGFA